MITGDFGGGLWLNGAKGCEVEDLLIKQAMEISGGDKQKAATLLGISADDNGLRWKHPAAAAAISFQMSSGVRM